MVDDEGAVDEMDEVTEVLGFMVDAISPACVPTTQRDRQAILLLDPMWRQARGVTVQT